MGFYWSLGGGDWVEQIDKWQHPQPILVVAGGNFPIFVVMIPQESGIGASGSLSKN